jgi:hypothetical protein
MKLLVNLGILAAIAFFITRQGHAPLPITSFVQSGCVVKGNVSIDTNRKIYHIPGMEDYDSTTIDSTRGEKWFCTESEAITNGWRKAPR